MTIGVGDLIRLRSSKVVLGRGDGISVGPAVIEIDKGVIIAVIHGDALESDNSPVNVTDLGDKLICPAFINAHTHISMSAFRGLIRAKDVEANIVESIYFELEAHLEPGDVRAFSRMGAYDNLLSGVGCVWDHYYQGLEVADALVDVGLGGVVAPTLQDINGPGLESLESQVTATEVISSSDTYRKAGVVAAVGPHATDTVSDKLLVQCRDLSQKLQVPLHIHVAQSIDEYRRSIQKSQASPISRLKRLGVLDETQATMLVHGLFVSEEDLSLVNPDICTLAYCPWSQVQFGFPAMIQRWRDAGIGVVLGTDAGAGNDTMDVALELRHLAWSGTHQVTNSEAATAFAEASTGPTADALWTYRQQIVDDVRRDAEPKVVLPSVWSIAGDMHPKLPLGEIAIGRVANILVLDLDHPSLWPAHSPLRALVLGNTSPAIHGMMVCGKWVGRPGDYSRSIINTERYKAHAEEAEHRIKALISRALG